MLNLKNTSLWAVAVPKGQSDDYEICRDQDNYDMRQFKYPSDKYMGLQNYSWFNLGEDNYKIIGTCTIDTMDFDPEPFVKKILYDKTHSYMDYSESAVRYPFDTPVESFRSLLTSSGVYFENPLILPLAGRSMEYDTRDTSAASIRYHEERHKKFAAWKAAQSNVVEKVVIINQVK